MMFYGVISRGHLRDTAIAVCDVFGRRPFDLELLLETCATETQLGSYPDKTPYKHGISVMQIDHPLFKHAKQKYKNNKINTRLKSAFGVDLAKVAYRELALNPLLGMIFARLAYWMVECPIPATLAERAGYWKKHYNTRLGKGEVIHYIHAHQANQVSDLVRGIAA
ncbi:hypothetical protein [Pseudoalteromonas rubra]|uniref:hypothetical protein n=1 Tax=Pseudoalteromonas rubra TaxID=43658 RepID=UPI002DBABDC9|nr:hypothetical protein [Pseudoalteromonas rubra]MEC4091593.1 hypothetical protein [Pseudoalteromonas rubra]